ncbi:hypothetical protein [Vibrio diabolicus]|uniref:hypothetical protein n=1 Tax=Vibrio diabolicus TaxID=50719 RepID=UPI0004F2C1CE|nr:hypothetical protein [Vibrio diabolicus]
MDNILDKVTINQVKRISKQYSNGQDNTVHRMNLTINYDDIHKVIQENRDFIYIGITDKNIGKTYYARLIFRYEDSELTMSLYHKLGQNIYDYVEQTNYLNSNFNDESLYSKFKDFLSDLGIERDSKITFDLVGLYLDLERDIFKDKRIILPFEAEDEELYHSYLYNLETVLRTKVITCS